MKRSAGLFICVLVITAMRVNSFAAERPALGAAPRYLENYEFLKSQTEVKDFFDPIKYIQLDSDPLTYISFGGEDRERFEAFLKNPLFGITRLRSDEYFLHRTLLHADLHVGEYFRSFVQFGYHNVWSKEGAITSTERSNVDLQQIFFETHLPLEKNEKLNLRVGRQEMPLGSQRLVSVREGPNVRQSFDAVRIDYDNAGNKFTSFLARPVLLRENAFDDKSDTTQKFWGIYSTLSITRELSVDMYYLGLNRERAKFAQGTADENRQTIGARLFGATSGVDYNFESAFQYGSFGQGKIQAWTFASDTGYSFKDLIWQPRIGLKADIASGDKKGSDKELNTFNALFPKGSYFTENALVGPANIIDLQPNITLKFSKAISVNFGADILWRESTQDAVYRQPTIAIAGTAGKPGAYTGTQYFVLGTWQIDSHLSLGLTYVHFAVANVIKTVGGGNNDYVGSWVSYRF